METWKPISFAPGYDVSDHGRVRSWRRWGGQVPGLAMKSRLLRLKVDRDGYRAAYLSIECETSMFRVHRLVALAFIGPPPTGKSEVRHLDGNPANNAPSNLAWGDGKENGADKVRHGRSLRGERQVNAKLTDDKVLQIVAARRGGPSLRATAKRFGVVQGTVCHVLAGRSWRHVTGIPAPGES